MQLERKDIESSLGRKGFRLFETHHRFYYLYVDGKKTGIYTYVSTAPKYKTLQAKLIGDMARELKLSKAEFADLIECKMSYDAYVARLRDQGVQV